MFANFNICLYFLNTIQNYNGPTHKQLEMYGCILNTVATDVLVLKHQGISTHSTDYTFIGLVSYKNITL